MKNVLIFISGIVFGMALLFCIEKYFPLDDDTDGLVFFEKEGECIIDKNLIVYQVLGNGAALVQVDVSDGLDNEKIGDKFLGGILNGLNSELVLLINKDGKYYYDGEKIQMPEKKCAQQVGVYTYMTQAEMQRTVPIVEIK